MADDDFEKWWASTWGAGGPYGCNVHLKEPFRDCWKAALDVAEKVWTREPECMLCGKPMGNEQGCVHGKCCGYENFLSQRDSPLEG